MEYALGLIIFGVLLALLYRMLKFSNASRYLKMTGRQFEQEAKRASPAAGVLLAVQKLVDPSHRVEHVEQAQPSQQDGTNPAAPPKTTRKFLGA